MFTILVFAFWYWEIDGGGPRQRHEAGHRAADFLFPQQAENKSEKWASDFFDYLFVPVTGGFFAQEKLCYNVLVDLV
jgi:hypothetical protein